MRTQNSKNSTNVCRHQRGRFLPIGKSRRIENNATLELNPQLPISHSLYVSVCATVPKKHHPVGCSGFFPATIPKPKSLLLSGSWTKWKSFDRIRMSK